MIIKTDFESVSTKIKRRQYNAKNNITNCIPFPFPEFAKDMPGIEKKTYTLISGLDKSGKTQLMSFLYIYSPLLYILNKEPDDPIDYEALYFNCEESIENIQTRWISFLNEVVFNNEVSYDNLMSSTKNNIASDYTVGLLDSGKMKNYMNLFESHVKFSNARKPADMIEDMENWALQNGEMSTNSKGEEIFIPDNPNRFLVIIIDHIGCIENTGKSLYETIKQFSKQLIVLRDKYSFSICVVQQQSADTESIEAAKINRFFPTKAGLADCKSTANDVDCMLGVYNPTRNEQEKREMVLGYKVYTDMTLNETALGDNLRFLKIVLKRYGKLGRHTALFTKGSGANFRELPGPKSAELQAIYDRIAAEHKAIKDAKEEAEKRKQTTLFANTVKFPLWKRIYSKLKRKKILRCLFTDTLKLIKHRESFDVAWEIDNIPHYLDVDNHRLELVLSDGSVDTCKNCFFHNKCNNSSIPCTATSFWVPVKDNESKKEVKPKEETKVIGFQQTKEEKNVKKTTRKRTK